MDPNHQQQLLARQQQLQQQQLLQQPHPSPPPHQPHPSAHAAPSPPAEPLSLEQLKKRVDDSYETGATGNFMRTVKIDPGVLQEMTMSVTDPYELEESISIITASYDDMFIFDMKNITNRRNLRGSIPQKIQRLHQQIAQEEEYLTQLNSIKFTDDKVAEMLARLQFSLKFREKQLQNKAKRNKIGEINKERAEEEKEAETATKFVPMRIKKKKNSTASTATSSRSEFVEDEAQEAKDEAQEAKDDEDSGGEGDEEGQQDGPQPMQQ